MTHNLALILALALPAALFIVLRINAALVFLSVCLGVVLLNSVAAEANDMIAMFIPRISSATEIGIEFGLLLGPAIATSVFTLLSMHGRIRVVANAVPAAAASMLMLLVAVPLLPGGLRFALESQQAWRILSNAEALVIGLGALVSLFFLWTQRSMLRHHDKRRR
jgi:hypothetical protein